MNILLFVFGTLLFIAGNQNPSGRNSIETNKTVVRDFIREFWNNAANSPATYFITCVCGERIEVTAADNESAVTRLIPAMDVHVASKEHPQVPKQLTREQKDGMVRATMRNRSAERFLAPDYIDHTIPPGMPQGIDGLHQMAVMFMAGFPDMRITVEDQIAEGDKVVSRVIMKGTNRGSFMNMPATGKEIVMRGVRIDRLAGGKIAEHWAVADQMSMMQQLGALPTPDQPNK